MSMSKAYWNALPALKSLLIGKHGKVCQKCGRKKANKKELVVHHLHYRTVGNEKIDDDVTLLCHGCHKAVHGH